MSSTTTTTTTSSTSSAKTKPELNVSLESHLIELLQPLLPILPQHIQHDLASFLPDATRTPPPVRVIPYSLLLAVSTWTRSPAGTAALQGLSPPANPGAYTMVSLLAGTRTSPEKNFPKSGMTDTVDPEQEAERDRNDRRAISALLNALLSIIGSGVAVWWAADRLHWKAEWKVLLALSVAMVVAISEGVLYLIWESRRSKEKSLSRRVHRFTATRHIRKMPDAPTVESKPSSSDPIARSLQQDHEQDWSIAGPHSHSTTLPSTQSSIQVHATADGLRERGGRQR